MVFVYSTDAFCSGSSNGTSNLTGICKQYNSTSDPGNPWEGTPYDLKVRPLNGQKINFAEVTKPNETALQTDSLTWGVEPPAGGPVMQANPDPFEAADQPQFYPVVKLATVRLRTAEAVAGGTGIGASPPMITINGAETTSSFNSSPSKNAFGLIQATGGYVFHGFQAGAGQNPGQAFVTITDESGHSLEQAANGPGLGFGGGNSGAIMTPNLNIAGLSRSGRDHGREHGDEFMDGTFDPITFFAGSDPKILGAISLWDIIQQW